MQGRGDVMVNAPALLLQAHLTSTYSNREPGG